MADETVGTPAMPMPLPIPAAAPSGLASADVSEADEGTGTSSSSRVRKPRVARRKDGKRDSVHAHYRDLTPNEKEADAARRGQATACRFCGRIMTRNVAFQYEHLVSCKGDPDRHMEPPAVTLKYDAAAKCLTFGQRFHTRAVQDMYKQAISSGYVPASSVANALSLDDPVTGVAAEGGRRSAPVASLAVDSVESIIAEPLAKKARGDECTRCPLHCTRARFIQDLITPHHKKNLDSLLANVNFQCGVPFHVWRLKAFVEFVEYAKTYGIPEDYCPPNAEKISREILKLQGLAPVGASSSGLDS